MSGNSSGAASSELQSWGDLIGRSVPRVEDARLLRGQARFIDDIVLPGMLHAVFARSRSAHARIKRVDTAAARAVAGVHAVMLYADLRPLLTCERIPLALAAAAVKFDAEPICLVDDEASYFGEPIALVVADSRAVAEDAATLIDVDYEELPVVTDPYDGLQPGAPRARLDCPDNLTAEHVVKYGDVDQVFAAAAHRFSEQFAMEKGGGFSIEPRGIVARYDANEDLLTVWDSTQTPHRAKMVMVQTLGLAEHQLRVIAPDVGGGFGPKAVFHPEEIAVPAAALLLRRPIKWIEDRLESFTATVQERRQIWDVEIAFDADGKLGGIRGRIYHDHGANVPYGVALPYNGITNMIGPYVLPALHLTASLCLTNMVPVAPTRGAGRPQGTFVMERVLDRIARTLNLARDEVRRRNLIPPEQMPYATPIKQRDGSVMTYDSGDYPECQRRALAAADWNTFEARRAAALREGRFVGIGLANYVEGTGRGPFESTAIRVGASGQIMVMSGATAQGQGTKTMLAQLAGSVFGVAPDHVHVVDGDTAATPLGLGAFASRQAVTAGNAALVAAQSVAAKAKAVASAMLEAAPEDLELKDGEVRVIGVPQLKKSLAEIARAVGGLPGFALPGNLPPGLAASCDYQPTGMTYTNGTHIAEAEVDPISGAVKILRYTVVHDCGRMINPMMVEGQVRGGVVHGIGMTLFELMRFDVSGQPLIGTLADYLLPTVDVVPRIDILHMESPTPLNPLGVKGAAESGTIGAPSAIVSAIEDALRPFDIRITELPILPVRLHTLVRDAQKAASSA